MSMLSEQVNKLRMLADKLRNVHARQGDDYVESCETLYWSMCAMLDAADTILSLRDRLQDAELGSGTCELIADLQEDKRTKAGYKLACIHCSACGEQHSGSICFREDGSYVIYRDEQDIFCRHCGSMITNDVDELSKAVKR